MAGTENFNQVAEQFNRYEHVVRGAVRYELTHQNLIPFIKPGMSVLDVCGGSGPDTAWFAQQGCNVTLIEPGADQIDIARRRFATLSTEEQSRIHYEQAELGDVPHDSLFDIVAVHGVAMYKEKPNEYRHQALMHVAPGGILSILDKGRIAVKHRLKREGDFRKLMEFENSGMFVNSMDFKVHTITPDGMKTFADSEAVEVAHMSGVRVSAAVEQDTRIKADVEPDEWASIVASEAEHGASPTGMRLAQMLHTIIRV